MKRVMYACFGLGGLLIVAGLFDGLQASARTDKSPAQMPPRYAAPKPVSQVPLRLRLHVEKIEGGYRVSQKQGATQKQGETISSVSGRYVHAGTHLGHPFYRRTTLPVRHLHFSEHDQNWKIVDNVKDIRICFAASAIGSNTTAAHTTPPTPTSSTWSAYSPPLGLKN